MFIIGVGSFGPSRNPRKGPRSIGSGPAENQHAEVEIRAPREARLDAQPQMTHGVVLKDMVMKRFVPAVAPERGDEGLLPYRAHAYREALATSTSSATTMVVHSSRDTMISFPTPSAACTPWRGSHRAVDHVHARGLPLRALEREPAWDCRMTWGGYTQHAWTDQDRSSFVPRRLIAKNVSVSSLKKHRKVALDAR